VDARAREWFWSFPGPELQQQDRTKNKKERGQRGSRPAGDRRQDDNTPELVRLLVSSGVDLWRHSAFTYDSLVWTPFGAGNDGFIFKAVAAGGSYRYRAGSLAGAPVTGWMAGAAVMPGVHFTRGGISVAAYFGLDIQVHRLAPFDPGNELYGRHLGLRMGIDLWTEPTPRSMIAASATLSTVGGHYGVRGAAGWRVLDLVYIGPEVIVYGGPEYRQVRLGVHATALRTALFDVRLEWQGGIGYAFDDDDNEGAYARLGVLWRH
jgi:hypothetical protein